MRNDPHRHSQRKPTADAKREFYRHKSREWHIQFMLPWEIWHDGARVARFRDERDARGFLHARYGKDAELINMQREADDDVFVPQAARS